MSEPVQRTKQAAPDPLAPEPRSVEDDEWLTQIGTRRRNGSFKFHNKPRPWRDPPEHAVS